MPCHDPRDSDPRAAREDGYEQAKRECRHNSDVAELLCFVMNNLNITTRTGLLSSNTGLTKWWREHVERDRKKAEREQIQAHNAAIDRQIRELQLKKKK